MARVVRVAGGSSSWSKMPSETAANIALERRKDSISSMTGEGSGTKEESRTGEELGRSILSCRVPTDAALIHFLAGIFKNALGTRRVENSARTAAGQVGNRLLRSAADLLHPLDHLFSQAA